MVSEDVGVDGGPTVDRDENVNSGGPVVRGKGAGASMFHGDGKELSPLVEVAGGVGVAVEVDTTSRVAMGTIVGTTTGVCARDRGWEEGPGVETAAGDDLGVKEGSVGVGVRLMVGATLRISS
jgi:hypothetical protein